MYETSADAEQEVLFRVDHVTLILTLSNSEVDGISHIISSVPQTEISHSKSNDFAILSLSYNMEYNISIFASLYGHCNRSKVIELKYGEFL